MKKPTLCAKNKVLERWPSQIWYLILDSDVRPTRGKRVEPRVTGKNKKAQHVLPMYPSLNDTLRNLASQLSNSRETISLSLCTKISFSLNWKTISQSGEPVFKQLHIYAFYKSSTICKHLSETQELVHNEIILVTDAKTYTFSPALCIWRLPKLTYK